MSDLYFYILYIHGVQAHNLSCWHKLCQSCVSFVFNLFMFSLQPIKSPVPGGGGFSESARKQVFLNQPKASNQSIQPRQADWQSEMSQLVLVDPV